MYGKREGVRNLSGCLVLALILVLTTGGTYGFADPADDTGSDIEEMEQSAREIRKQCETPEGEALVRKNLMERFGLTNESITELRDRGLGYGEIGILESLSQASGTESAELLRLRTEEKMGWGRIASRVNASVGQAMRSMRGLGRSGDRAIGTEKPAKPGTKGPGMEQGNRPDKWSRPERTERPGRPEKPERPVKPERHGKF